MTLSGLVSQPSPILNCGEPYPQRGNFPLLPLDLARMSVISVTSIRDFNLLFKFVAFGHSTFFQPIISPTFTNVIGILDNNFHQSSCNAAREVTGLIDEKSLPALDPRPHAMKIKGLRAFSASVLLDCGSSLIEYLYCCGMRTRRRPSGSMPGCLGTLWGAWVQEFANVVPQLGMYRSNVTELDSRRGRDIRAPFAGKRDDRRDGP
jgi:hypothetical protein